MGFVIQSIMLGVGLAMDAFSVSLANVCVLIIAVVTFIICMAVVYVGKVFGMTFACKASALGGFILIGIGIEI